MTLDVVLSPLALEAKNFTVGDTVRVTASFLYTVGEDTSVTVQAGPYHYVAGVLDRIGACFGSTSVSLPKTTTPIEKQFTIDFELTPASIIGTGGIQAGTYGLIVELPGTDFKVKHDSVLIVAAAPGILDAIGPLLVLGIMMFVVSKISPMMEEGLS